MVSGNRSKLRTVNDTVKGWSQNWLESMIGILRDSIVALISRLRGISFLNWKRVNSIGASWKNLKY